MPWLHLISEEKKYCFYFRPDPEQDPDQFNAGEKDLGLMTKKKFKKDFKRKEIYIAAFNLNNIED